MDSLPHPDCCSEDMAATATDAENPFDISAKSDVILRSSDLVDFFVLRAVLRLASPVFDDMFSLTQGETSNKNLNEMKNGLPIIRLAEDGTTMYNVLLLVHGYAKEPMKSIDICARMGEVAQKYMMDDVIKKLRKLVFGSEAMVKEPLRAFAIAVHFGWEEVMKESAMNTLSIPLRQLGEFEELRMMTGKDFSGLLQWRFSCQDALDRLLVTWTGPTTSRGRSKGWARMATLIREKLNQTGCPRTVALMDESVLAEGFAAEGSKANLTDTGHYKKVLGYRKAMETEINETISKVPLNINGIWVVPQSMPMNGRPELGVSL